MRTLELFGWAMWCYSFALENVADVQKMRFGADVSRRVKVLPSAAALCYCPVCLVLCLPLPCLPA